MTVPAETRCAICDEAAEDPRSLSRCLRCGRWFHLRVRMDRPGKDCGDAVVSDTIGVEMVCRACLDAEDEEAARMHADMTHEQRTAIVARTIFGDIPPPPGLTPPGGGS